MKSKKCRYCSEGHLDRVATKDKTYLISTYIAPDDDFVLSVLDRDRGFSDNIQMDFNYCPVCGRKLKKGKR